MPLTGGNSFFGTYQYQEGIIEGNQNKWNASNTSPVFNTDYSSYQITGTPPTYLVSPLYIKDSNPSLGPGSECLLDVNMKFSESSTFMAFYEEEAPLSEDKVLMVERLEKGFEYLDSANYLNAFDSFKDILQMTVTNPSPLQVLLIDLSYDFIKYSLAHAYKDALISNENLSSAPYISTILDIQEGLITIASDNGDYVKQYSVSMDRAQIYLLAEQKQVAIDRFYDVLSWAADENVEFVQNWICSTGMEDDLVNGSIDVEEFIEITESCGPGYFASITASQKPMLETSATTIEDEITSNT